MAVSEKNIRHPVTMPKTLKNALEKKAKAVNRSLNNYIVTVLLQDVSKDKPNQD